MQLFISESATLVEKAGFKKGDRVVVNVNTPKEPAYFLGTVTRVSAKDKLVHTLLDNGGKMKAVVANTGGGVVGYANHKRVRKTAIPTANVQNHIDTSKWYAKKIDKPVAGERIHVPESKPTVPQVNEPPKATPAVSFDEKSAKVFLKKMRSGSGIKAIIKGVKDVPSAQAALTAIKELKAQINTAHSVAKKATASTRAHTSLKVDKNFALSKLSDAEADIRATMKGIRKSGAKMDGKGDLDLAMTAGPHSKELFEKLNGKSSFPKMVNEKDKSKLYHPFAFWRDGLKQDKLPFPVAMKVPGYNKAEFIKKLEDVQKRASVFYHRGKSPHRWTGLPNMDGTYYNRSKRIMWPAGAITYLKAGVPPSRDFYRMVMGKDLPALPY